MIKYLGEWMAIMNFKINKDKIKMFGTFTLVSAYMLGQLKLEVSCRETKHREELCPVTRLEMLLGLDTTAMDHQENNIWKELNTGDGVFPKFGILEHKYISYGRILNPDGEIPKYSCLNVLDDGNMFEIIKDERCERVGTGYLTGDDYVELRSTRDTDILVTGEYSNAFAGVSSDIFKILNSINYIGPVGKGYPDVVVLEDRDGNKKEVVSLNNALTEEQVAKLFKTYYFDENDGFYKIDEDLFTEFMRTAFATREYANKIVTVDVVNGHKNITVTCPAGYVLNDKGLCYRDINPYEDFSFYSFRMADHLNKETYVRKLVK